MDQIERQDTITTNSSRISSFFPQRTRRKSGNDVIGDEIKGPLGLNTLYDPSEPAIADLIFVHGMSGGSRSTWSKNNDPDLYWPKEWLPKDNGFRDVRIHSFGYNSNWEKESTLNIQDFAKSLLGDMHDCPIIPRDSSAPIILVGHSMGGLLIKRAYIMAKQNTEFSSVAGRIRAALFLATPHRGADYAPVLTRILNLSPGPRPFITDLHRNSLATQSINDEFPLYCSGLQLFSFYETLPTNLVIGKILVVDKDLATLGYANERTALLNANHRGVCKYANKRDPNYSIVRNALASVIDGFRHRSAASKNNINHEQRKLLDSFLGTSDAAEDDFMSVESSRISGSCEWLMRKPSYLEWQDSPSMQLYWISAKPATGKTVLSGKVVSHLKEFNKDCCFCFFDHGNKAKSNLASFLLLMARQMASMHPEIMHAVLELAQKDDQLKKADYRMIWRILYLEAILKQRLVRRQYWVVDALDECQAGSDLVPLLIKVMKALPVSIFLTSRDSIEIHRANIPPTVQVVWEEISRNDTQSDIDLYLQRHMDELPAIDDEDRDAMKKKLLIKSEGCFLWVSLVLQELKRVHTSAEIRKVLEDVPSDMDELYSRILDIMSRQQYGKTLAKAILTWTVCAARPLTTAELEKALQYHIRDKVHGIQRAILSYCGQLVYVDAQTRVQVVHQTVRDFLLRAKTTSEFGIEKKVGHTQLAMACLEYLNGPEMAGPTRRKLIATNANAKADGSAFANYACKSFYEHILQVSSEDEYVLEALYNFLSSHNVLSWIEYVAQHSDLKPLIQAGKTLKNFLQRRAKYIPHFGKEELLLDLWATDLVKLVTKFGKNLLEKPSSIHFLIPPFCPPGSAPRKLVASSARVIQLVGLSNKTWGDCLSTIIDPQEQFAGLGCSATHFAIGMTSGTIRIFNQTTCQEVKTLPKMHLTPVRLLRFGVKGDILVSGSSKSICVWDKATWTQLWDFKIPIQPMSINLADDDQILLVSLKNNHFKTWDLSDGTEKYSDNWTHELEGTRARSFHRPIAAACNVEERLLAVVYRGQDILLWDFEDGKLLDTYTKEAGAVGNSRRTVNGGVISVVFGAGPNVTLLAAAYLDGDLVVFDTTEGIVKHKTLANAQILASSPDGRTLATGDSAGMIQLYDFGTLKLMYRIRSDNYAIKSLKFSTDSLRILDVRASQCQVWDPTILIRQEIEEELSDTVSISTYATHAQEIGTEAFEDIVLITSLACHSSLEVFFVGKEDGAVYLHETKTGAQVAKLCNHADGVAIVGLHFDNEANLLISIDSSSRVVIHKILYQSNRWVVDEPIFDERAGVAVDQLIFSDRHKRVLICSSKADTLWDVDIDTPDRNHMVATKDWDEVRSYRWSTHPANPDQLIFMNGRVAHLYEWKSLRRLTSDEGIPLQAALDPELTIRSITPCFCGSGIATAFGESSNRRHKSKFLLWDVSDFTPESSSAATIPSYLHLMDDIDFLIRADTQRLVFLHGDNWICSTDPQNPSHLIRHFFLPADWLTSNAELMIEMTSNGDILFVKKDEVAVIKRGLDNVELSANVANGRRPSPISRGSVSSGRRRSSTVVRQVTYQPSKTESGGPNLGYNSLVSTQTSPRGGDSMERRRPSGDTLSMIVHSPSNESNTVIL